MQILNLLCQNVFSKQIICVQTVCNGDDTMSASNSSADICRRKMWVTKYSKKTSKLLHANTDGESCFEDIFHPLVSGIEARQSIFQSGTVWDKESLHSHHMLLIWIHHALKHLHCIDLWFMQHSHDLHVSALWSSRNHLYFLY